MGAPISGPVTIQIPPKLASRLRKLAALKCQTFTFLSLKVLEEFADKVESSVSIPHGDEIIEVEITDNDEFSDRRVYVPQR